MSSGTSRNIALLLLTRNEDNPAQIEISVSFSAFNRQCKNVDAHMWRKPVSEKPQNKLCTLCSTKKPKPANRILFTIDSSRIKKA